MITDDPSAQGATDDAFDLLHRILAMRLRRGRLTVVDATNVEEWARAELVADRPSPPTAGRRDRPGRAAGRSRSSGTPRAPRRAHLRPPCAGSIAG